MNTPLQIFIMGEDATSLFWWPCEHVPSVGEIIATLIECLDAMAGEMNLPVNL